jgi:hypothetical protein
LLLVAPFDVADILTVVVVDTFDVLMTKVADFCPPATVTLGGTVATAGLALRKETGKPAAQAGFAMDTVAVTACPPITGVVKVKLLAEGGVTVKTAFRVVTPEEAISVTAVLLHCGVLVIGTARYVAPAGTVTTLGTEATAGLLLENLTCHPPGGANVPRNTTTQAATPPGTEGGLTLIAVSAGCKVSEVLALDP